MRITADFIYQLVNLTYMYFHRKTSFQLLCKIAIQSPVFSCCRSYLNDPDAYYRAGKCPYSVLKVNPCATKAEVKAAYFDRCKEVSFPYHVCFKSLLYMYVILFPISIDFGHCLFHVCQFDYCQL